MRPLNKQDYLLIGIVLVTLLAGIVTLLAVAVKYWPETPLGRVILLRRPRGAEEVLPHAGTLVKLRSDGYSRGSAGISGGATCAFTLGWFHRFQRLTGDLVQPFNDAAPSIPVGFTSATWGSLASFGAKPYPGTKKWYGTSGNSFVAVVEFGPQVHAIAVTAGGESGHPANPHFNDEAQRYSTGDLREVYFYRGQLQDHTAREYHPGD